MPMISVLYVDDNPDLLAIGKFFLENDPRFSVDIAQSATEALEKLEHRAYNAIVSDYQMPKMNGIQFLKKIRTSGNNIPFIIFTGRGREEIVIQALNEGANFYLQKGGEPEAQYTELMHQICQAVQQRKTEAHIKDLERREADIINFLPDATFAIDIHGIVIAWNPAMETMTGIRAAEILGKNDFGYAIPFYRERRPLLIDLVLHDDLRNAVHYPFITREGQNLIAETTIPHFNNGKGGIFSLIASPLYDNRGVVAGAIQSVRDITWRKHMEESLRETTEANRRFFMTSRDCIFVTTKDGRWIDLNDAALELFGYSEREELMQVKIPDLYASVEDRIKHISIIAERGYIKEYPVDLRRKDGTVLSTRITSVARYDAQGNVTGFQGTIRDVTAQKKKEEAMSGSREPDRGFV